MKLRLKGAWLGVVLGLVTAGLAPAGGAYAQSLTDVLAATYLNNPTLRAERARQRATDENVSQALSGWRPSVFSGAEANTVDGITKPRGPGPRLSTDRDPRNLNLTVTQPVFNGFKTVNGTKQAEADVIAGLQALISVEQQVLLNGVASFMNVVRDLAIVNLRRKNVMVLREQLRASDARFKVGEITRTDVAQSRARLSGSDSDLALATANLESSRATFAQIVGRAPGSLKRPRSVRKLMPKTLDEAIAMAEETNPDLLSAAYTEESSEHAIDVARGDLYPEVSLEGRYDRTYGPSSFNRLNEEAQATARLTVPLYQAGSVSSRVRQAKQTASQRRLQTFEVRRSVQASVIQAWETLRAARRRIQAARVQVDANQLALRGVRQEADVGSRTTLDVLDAEQELVDSQVNQVTAERDEVVATYQVLSTVGRLTARTLHLPVELYDPGENYRRVRNKIFGTGIGD